MSFGSTPDTFLYEIFFSLGALASIGLLILLGALIQRLFRIRAGCFIPIFVIVVVVGTILGLSLYLDTAGELVPATITKKLETIHYRDEGDWQHNYEVWASYQLADGSAPSAHFTTTPAYFDTLYEGGQVRVRSVSINQWFNLARFADQSTWTWIPWVWLQVGSGVILVGFIGWQLLKRRGGWVLLVILLLLLATLPFVNKYNDWRAANDPSRTPLHANGVIQEVEEVTTIDPMPGDGSGNEEWDTSIEVAQRYAIVVVRYTPQGYREAILGVDAVDLRDDSQPLLVDSSVEINYAANDPRTVRLPNRTREHHLRNPLEWIKQQLFALGLGAALILLAGWIGNRWQRFLAQRIDERVRTTIKR